MGKGLGQRSRNDQRFRSFNPVFKRCQYEHKCLLVFLAVVTSSKIALRPCISLATARELRVAYTACFLLITSRVISIGYNLDELQTDPQAGYKTSVEFCGGT